MECRNCGAPMTLFREQEYFRCEYCGSYCFPTPSRDGVRALGPAPKSVPCPLCTENLLLASLDNQYRAYQCPKCLGLLVQCAEFARLTTARRAWAAQPADPLRTLDRGQLARRISCPLCGRPMDTHAYGGPGAIVIDTCEQCNFVWLDYGELSRIVNAPGRDRGAALLQNEQLLQLLNDLAVASGQPQD